MVAETTEDRRSVRQQAGTLVILAMLALICFVAVTGLSRAYRTQRHSLGDRWFTRGVADLSAGRFERAVTEFRAALLYSRDNYMYQLNLAEALLGLRRTSEASTYLLSLWDRQPEDGLVNLELARIAAQKGQTQQAVRYYHNAIYAAWTRDEEGKRRDARIELIEFLLGTNSRAQAQSELIALEENLGEDASQQKRVGDLFLRTQDYEHALAAYRLSLKADRENAAALAGAGLAAFELGRYALAARYLQTAVAADSNDSQSADRLKTTEMVLGMDPFRRQISVAQRDRIVVEAFTSAGQRLRSCDAARGPSVPTRPQASLTDSWARMSPRISERALKQDPDLVESAMELVFEIERQTNSTCGPPSGTDRALLLVAKLHEGS